MCDYSLMNVPNRLAVEGEELAVHRFRSGSMGLVSSLDWKRRDEPKPATPWEWMKQILTVEQDIGPAVCIPPGARLRVYDMPASLQAQYRLGPEEAVTFAQLSATAGRYRDAIVFANGRAVLLQELEEGQRVRVLWVDTDEQNVKESETRLADILA